MVVFFVLLDFPFTNLNLLFTARGLLALLILFSLAYLTVSAIELYAKKYRKSITKGKITAIKYSKIKAFFWIIGILAFIIFWTLILSNFHSYFENFGIISELTFFIILVSPFVILLIYAFASVKN